MYNKELDIHLSYRFPGLQNILRVELFAIYEALKITNNKTNSTYIFTDSLNIPHQYTNKTSTIQNNHPNKTILQKITKYLINYKAPIIPYTYKK
jgi:hypothetical protein